MNKVKILPGKKFKHKKHGLCEIVAISHNDNSSEDLVIYATVLDNDHKTWTIPYSSFIQEFSEVDDKRKK